ncbi:MAG: hypothetical protein M3R38_14210 [Actinomycetota bacterium]|nr:hypothetical protein [Actinomycetota bacterium]
MPRCPRRHLPELEAPPTPEPPLEEEEVRRIAASVARYAPASREVNKEFEELVRGDGKRPANMPYNTTDYGNAERLVARHGEDLRYIHAWEVARVCRPPVESGRHRRGRTSGQGDHAIRLRGGREDAPGLRGAVEEGESP